MRKIFITTVLMAAMLFAGSAFAAKTFIRISTSTVGGGFYLIGNTIAQLGQVKMADEMNFTAVTGGSIKNMMNLEKGECELGLTQSSTLALGIAGEAPFKAPLKKLRYVTSIYPMPAHILINKRSGIKSVADFKGKRIDYGSVGQGIETNVRELMSMYGLEDKDVKIERFGRSEFEEAFKTDRIEGTLWTTTTPNAQISDLIRSDVVGLLSMEKEKLDAMLKRYPHYIATTIPGGTYEGISTDTLTFGAVGSLLTHDGMPDEVIYKITKMLHENSDFLKERLGSYFAGFNLEFALSGMGETLLHPGAAKYYKEKGLIK
ncbi:TRAP transporter solute receptor, TAXI family [uncultured delta proteobacterium]|uniref:TRAP transporter solute receptor, TAXI family n=1 Tax=uncultured delta proteobacterium TaxID=34034 RepID=A0A212J2B6_9DELT|nr:TRAP transporter solute receptor, TAXI family [uncultured delta proteobacterium]